MVNLIKYKNDNPNNNNILTPLKSVYGDTYDLSVDPIIDIQVEMAKKYKFYGFGMYYYWFSKNSLSDDNMIFRKVIDRFFEKEFNDFKIFFIFCN